MNIREAILAEHSKAQAEKITAWIGHSASRFKTLMQLFLNDEYRVVQRAAWIVSMVAERHPDLIEPYLEEMVERLTLSGQHPAVRRNVVRVLDYMDEIPESVHGPVMNACFDFAADPKEAIAVRAFSITVLGKLARIYPDMIPELKTVLEDMLSHDPTPALVVRVKRVFKELKMGS